MAEVSIAQLEEELKTMREQQDIAGELLTLRRLGLAFQRNRQFTKAVSCLSKVLMGIQDGPNIYDRAIVHASLGCVYWEMAQLKKAMTQLQLALQIQKQIQDAPGQVCVLTLMGISSWRKCRWEEGLAYFSEVQELSQIDPPANKPGKGDYSFLTYCPRAGVGDFRKSRPFGPGAGRRAKNPATFICHDPALFVHGKKKRDRLSFTGGGFACGRIAKKRHSGCDPKTQGVDCQGVIVPKRIFISRFLFLPACPGSRHPKL